MDKEKREYFNRYYREHREHILANIKGKQILKEKKGERPDNRIKTLGVRTKTNVCTVQFNGYAEKPIDTSRTQYEFTLFCKEFFGDKHLLVYPENLSSRKGWYLYQVQLYIQKKVTEYEKEVLKDRFSRPVYQRPLNLRSKAVLNEVASNLSVERTETIFI